MSSSQQQSLEQVNYSIYIPTINKKYGADYIVYLFWKAYLGNIDRIDFVPIVGKMKDDPLAEDPHFWQAFIYVRPKTQWGKFMTDALEKDGSYRFYPNQQLNLDLQSQCNPNEYWVILKNKSPVPYAQTHLNIHQLAHNNSLLETKVSDMEEEMLKMKEEIARLKDENDTLLCQTKESINRNRCDSHSTTESEAESFVNSWENILRMMEEQQTINKEDYDALKAIEQEEDLVYDDSGEMTPRGRIIKKDANADNCHNYAMLDIDGYNNGDVAPRGWKVSIEDDGETSPRFGYENDGESSPRGNYEDDGDYHDEEVFVRCEVEDFSRNDDDDRAEHDLGNRFRIGTDVNWSGDE